MNKKLCLLTLKKDSVMENKIRKQWLISFYLLFGWSYMLKGYQLLLGPEKWYIRLSIIISFLLSAWFSYYFAFKTKGTKWLLFLLIMLPIESMRRVGDMIDLRFDLGFGTIIIVTSLLTFYGLRLYFWISCLLLFRINSSLKKKKSES